MPLKETNTYIQELIDAGPDAFNNLYYVEFSGSLFDVDTTNSFRIRANGFTPPTFTQGVEGKNYMTVSVDMPKPEISGDKSFSIDFRLDEGYNVYEILNQLMAKTYIPNLGYVNTEVNDSQNDGFNVSVYAYNGKGEMNPSDGEAFKKLYEFRHCFVENITQPTYTYSGATALTVGAKIRFWDFDDPTTTLDTFRG